jgi:outer membrane protein assembly factor BamB/tetratricopeptide (TPR) repeat protein
MILLIIVLAFCSPPPSVAASFPYTLQWKRLVPGIVGGALVEGDSLVFLGTTDGRVLALERRDGIRRWQRRGYGPLRRPLALVDGAPAFADAWGGVQVLAPDSGQTIWTFRRRGWGDAELRVGPNLVYASGADGWLYALERDGREVWRVRVGTRLAARPLFASARLYAPTTDGRLLVLDAKSGALLQSLETGALALAGINANSGRLLAAFGDGYVRAYDQRTLAALWERRLGAKTALLVLEKILVCAADNGWLYGLDQRKGDLLWKRALGGVPTGPAVRGPRGEVAVGTTGGRVVAVDPDTGDLVWDVQMLEGLGARLEGTGDRLYVRAGDDHLYAFAEAVPLAAEGEVLWEAWWEVLDQGNKTGYRRQQLRSARRPEGEIWRLVDELVQWRGSFRRRTGQVLVGRDFRPIVAEERIVEGSQIVSFTARWDADSLHVERRLADRAIAASASVDSGAVPVEVALLKLAREGRARPGRRDSLRVFDYDYLENRWLYAAFGQEEETPFGKGLAVQLGFVEDVAELLVWIDGEGRPLRLVDLRTGDEQVRVDEARARAWVPPGPGRSVRLSHPVENPVILEELIVSLPDSPGDWERLLVEDQRQELRLSAGGRRQLVVRAVAYDGRDAPELPIRDPALAPYLQSSLYIQADDPRILALATRLRGDQRDAWKVALHLRQWVYDNMMPRNTNVRFKSTLEVLEDMEGTCSEYAALYLALCRAVGLPARAAVGFLVAEGGELALHIWTQVYVGEWVDLDPSWASATVDAAHIKTGQGLLTAAGLRQLNGPLSLWLAQVDTLALVEYRAEGRRFTSRAESLYTAASEAERKFAEERAQVLYHQVVAEPWNHRSGTALVNIARYRLQRGALDDAEWALERLLRLDPGDEMDAGLFYLSRLADARDEPEQSRAYLERLLREFPDGDLADDALGQLAEKAQREGGCQAAIPYYQRLSEEYSRSGWASVAESALERCEQRSPEGP